ncbi:CRISPR-associated exonuclease Cas4/endonuclease Cas1 fusion [wastewater metagenome]|uniref:5' to 3' exodeoxyribonuclease (nucleoside 3'-phosphate-forming) n=2 Tax=unclassified sequences TaxID=12908 RepID=A0A5B8REG3_9ZZZZ|nr:CRISPR-associated endonuclease Cas1 [Arhodomonas sp. KWT]QEA05872.1 CRISPR-associated exonuclease Cas4/endonuclease Cas1 fusion [uncultured organism]
MTDRQQRDLPLPFPELNDDQPLLPARMINEYEYCPRLAYLEWVQGEWADSGDTVSGRRIHRRVDSREEPLPDADADSDERLHSRSVTLSSNRLGLIAKLDIVETEGDEAMPVDYKRGKRPHVEKGAYLPEQVQLCVQGMLLEEHGYRVEAGTLYFRGSRERVRIPFDDELRERTVDAVSGLRALAAGGRIPPPLEDSPKCPRCSLVTICLPDEVNNLRRLSESVRPLSVMNDEAMPLYVQAHRAAVRKKGEVLEITVEDESSTKARLRDVSQLVLMGNVYVTTPTLHELMRREIPVTWHSYGGWFLGHSQGTGHKNVELRTAQYRRSFDDAACLHIARRLVANKVVNSRTLLRRNIKTPDESSDELLEALNRDARRALRAEQLDELLGIEGTAAARYFGAFSRMIRPPGGDAEMTFDFSRRNRRPPADPVNALLSYAYSVLVRAWTVTLSAVGFDTYRGFYHQPRYGRPALALDMMEPFRPLIAESAVLTAINKGQVRPTDFITAASAVNLTRDGRKRFLATIEQRLDQEITHPDFGYRASYRRILEIQARLAARHVMGEVPEFPGFVTR